MDVTDATLKSLIEGQNQFAVPIWQRQYTWKANEHAQLWDDVLEQYRHLVADRGDLSGHFLGSFVLSPESSVAAGVTTFLVIDGQQRLTTLMLLICAIRDSVADSKPNLIEQHDSLYLVNAYQEGAGRMRLLPTEEDREPYRRIVEREPDQVGGDLVSAAYRFMRQRVDKAEQDGLDLEQLIRAVVERLEIVAITTAPTDNIHRIFQSINGTGVDLDQADLLRNHFFMLLPNRATEIYEAVWRPMEKLVGVGALAGLARVDLLRRGTMVSWERVYAEHQRLLTPIAHDETKVEERISEFAHQARLYKRLIDPSSEEHPPTRDGLQRLARWGAQTSHPVLIIALDLRDAGVLDDDQLARCVLLVESFLIRRQLDRIPTNALNRAFVQLVDRLPRDDSFVHALHRELSRDRLYWPNDDKITQALRIKPFFHIGQWHQRKLILERLEQSYEHPELVNFSEVNLQIEHIMPQTLTEQWRVDLEALGENPGEVHAEFLHTLGNLTLTAFNGTLSNDPFERKQQIYSASHLELNRALAENEKWGAAQILVRADELAEQVTKIWPAPIPGVVSEDTDGFDWSRIEAAIAAIPPGRWTTYGELAELGGTGAVPVGGHVAQMGGETNAYRVLTSDGSISAGFAWKDSGDQRDVRDVLSAEGVHLDDHARADPSQHASAEELASLIDHQDDPGGEETGLEA